MNALTRAYRGIPREGQDICGGIMEVRYQEQHA